MANEIPNVTIGTTVSPEFYKFCKENRYSWHEALSRGVRVLMDEKEGLNWKQAANELTEKIAKLQRINDHKNQDLWKMEQNIERIKTALIKNNIEIEEVKEVLKDLPLNEEEINKKLEEEKGYI